MTYNQIPLHRHQGMTAHIEEDSYRVLFAPEGSEHSALLFDQYRNELSALQPPKDRSEQKRTVTSYFVLTDGCNLSCEYCDVLGPSGKRRAGTTMSWETAEKGLEILTTRLENEPDLHAQITFFGGEPVLAWGLIERICDYIECHPLADRIAKMLVTNGTLIDRYRAQYLSRHHVYVVVSLDGGMEVNDSMRPGSFASVERGMDMLREVMPGKFGISCTVGSHNAHRLSDELRFLNHRFEPLSIGLNIYHYQIDGTSPIDMDHQEMSKALVDAFRVARQEGIAIYQFIGILKAFAGQYRNRDYCPACVDKLLFTPSGNVGRCETLINEPGFTVPLAEIESHILPEHLDWTKFTPEHEPECRNCATRWICPGSCAYDMYVTTGNPAGVDRRRCQFHTELLTEMLDLLFEGSTHVSPEKVYIPDGNSFFHVVGGMQTVFPPDTIWIVSLSNVTESNLAAT